MDCYLVRPWMTVVIATYNSEKYLPKIHKVLASQVQPEGVGALEVIAVDGGSTDKTRELAISYGYRVIDNLAGHAIAAKHIGLTKAASRLVCFLDHDELFTSTTALSRRYELFLGNPNLRAMISAGYRFGVKDSSSNMYASEFGDPVSMVAYRCPNNEIFRIRALSQRLKVDHIDDEAVLFRAGSESKPILCEMAAGSGVVDADFYRENYPTTFEDENAVPHLYYYLKSIGANDLLGVIKHDAILHDSVDSWNAVRKKISWRINNAVNSTVIAKSGFNGRDHSKMYSPKTQIIKYLIYCLTVVGPVRDSIHLSLTRRRFGYLNHFGLVYFVLFESIRLRIRRKNQNRTLNRYGEN